MNIFSKNRVIKNKLIREIKQSDEDNRVRKDLIDINYISIIILLMGLSLVMVYSASVAYSFKLYGNTAHFLGLQLLYQIISGLVAAVVFVTVPSEFLRKNSLIIIYVILALLVIVLIPHVGRQVNGARRWINLIVVNIQPSELAKLGFAIFLANLAAKKELNNFKVTSEEFLKKPNMLLMLLIYLVSAVLLLKEPDMGSLVVITMICFSILLLGGFNSKYLLAIGGFLLISFVGLVMAASYRLSRVTNFYDPWKDPFGNGYQLSHSLLAISNGSWFGRGLGNSIEKLLYLPEAHTDFILAIIAEEFGFVGIFVVILLFAILFYIGFFKIAKSCVRLERMFQCYLVQAISVWFMIQMLFNLGVCVGILPTKGLTLPFISFGGSSLLANMLAVACILRIDFENRRLINGEH